MFSNQRNRHRGPYQIALPSGINLTAKLLVKRFGHLNGTLIFTEADAKNAPRTHRGPDLAIDTEPSRQSGRKESDTSHCETARFTKRAFFSRR
jgi:hypothetical protein